jgi:hypothetical protein
VCHVALLCDGSLAHGALTSPLVLAGMPHGHDDLAAARSARASRLHQLFGATRWRSPLRDVQALDLSARWTRGDHLQLSNQTSTRSPRCDSGAGFACCRRGRCAQPYASARRARAPLLLRSEQAAARSGGVRHASAEQRARDAHPGVTLLASSTSTRRGPLVHKWRVHSHNW